MDPRTLVLIGRTGNGKSSTGNSILEKVVFESKRSSKSVTKTCQLGEREWNGRKIQVIDTPGLFDTDAKRSFVEKEIANCVDLANDGVHAFILVLSIQGRFTEEEASAFEKVQMLFGPGFLDYMIIVFTGGDQLKKDDEPPKSDKELLEDYLKETSLGLKKLLRRCNKRVVLFNNKNAPDSEKKNQIDKLMTIVDRTVAENEDSPYTNELFEKAKSIASDMYYIQDKDKAYQCKIKTLNEMMAKNLQSVKEEMQETIEDLREQLQDMGKEKQTEAKLLKRRLAETRKQLEISKALEADRYKCRFLS